MWHKFLLLFCFGFLLVRSAKDVGETCVPSNEILDGICTIITECEVAVNALKNRRPHSLERCGFSGVQEIVCCPRTTEKFGPPERGKLTERKADRECKKILEAGLVPVELHIIGGDLVSPGEFPHMVALGFDRGDGYKFDCGGALVSTNYVITAAHCIINLERVKPTIVRAGMVELGSSTWNDDTDYRIADTIVHPDYARSTKYHDLALIRLERPVNVSSYLNAACLYTNISDPQDPLIVTGWGKTSTTQNLKSDILLKTTVWAVSQEKCGPVYSNWRKLPSGITNAQLCAGDPRGGHDACQGDSGGPLQVVVGEEGQARLVGVISFGSGCGSSTPGVYTRLAHYLDWIEENVWPD